jgi:hypothetical protein
MSHALCPFFARTSGTACQNPRVRHWRLDEAHEDPFGGASGSCRKLVSNNGGYFYWRVSGPRCVLNLCQTHRLPFFDGQKARQTLAPSFLYWSVQSQIVDVKEISILSDKKI